MEVIFTDNINERKANNRVRNLRITFRVTLEERDMIERRMAQTGIKNMRAFLLKQAVDGRVIHIELDSVKETGNIYATDVEDLSGGMTSFGDRRRRCSAACSRCEERVVNTGNTTQRMFQIARIHAPRTSAIRTKFRLAVPVAAAEQSDA